MLAGTTLKAALDRGVPLSEPLPMSAGVSPGAVAWWTFNKSRVITAPDGSELQVYADLSTVLAAKAYREDTILPVQVRYSRLWLETTPTSVNVTEVMGPVVMPALAAPIAAALELGKPVGEWRNGEWFVRLVPRTVAGQPDLFAVCWEYRMPDLDRRAHVITDGGSEERLLPAGPPLQRVQCLRHRRSDAVDVGATVEEAGMTYTGSWGAPEGR
jgi:hypothetical protein